MAGETDALWREKYFQKHSAIFWSGCSTCRPLADFEKYEYHYSRVSRWLRVPDRDSRSPHEGHHCKSITNVGMVSYLENNVKFAQEDKNDFTSIMTVFDTPTHLSVHSSDIYKGWLTNTAIENALYAPWQHESPEGCGGPETEHRESKTQRSKQ